MTQQARPRPRRRWAALGSSARRPDTPRPVRALTFEPALGAVAVQREGVRVCGCVGGRVGGSEQTSE